MKINYLSDFKVLVELTLGGVALGAAVGWIGPMITPV